MRIPGNMFTCQPHRCGCSGASCVRCVPALPAIIMRRVQRDDRARAPAGMPSRSRSGSRSGTDAKKKSRSRSPAAKVDKARSRSPAKDAKDAKDKEAPRKRDETPPNVKAARLTVQNLTRNVGGEHLKEIFGTFGYVC